MRPKISVPPCKFCHKQFRRNEHLRRHERIHTQEKPFPCHCGRAFTRRDLLSRHAKFAHSSPIAAQDQEQEEQSFVSQPSGAEQGEGLCSAASQVTRAPAANADRDTDPQSGEEAAAFSETDVDGIRSAIISNPPATSQPQASLASSPPAIGQHAPIRPTWDMSLDDDLDLLWRGLDSSDALFMPPSFGSCYPMNFLASTPNGFPEFDPWQMHGDTHNCHGGSTNDQEPYHHNRNNGYCSDDYNDNGDLAMQPVPRVLSRYGSRLPSLQPGEESQQDETTRMPESMPHRPSSEGPQSCGPASPVGTSGTPWRISKEAYRLITSVVQSCGGVLPRDFSFPSRHALCRYVEGYFSGFHEHLPFIHRPTISLVTAAPELTLAIAAVGAQYRFQRKQAYYLYLGARAVLEDQLRCRNAHNAPDPGTPGFLANGNFPSLSQWPVRESDPSAGPQPASSGTNPCRNAMEKNSERDLQTMQAMIILIAIGTWNNGSQLNDALPMATQLALMVRQECRLFADLDTAHPTWAEWVAVEGRRRTMMIAVCFLNFHLIAYNITPQLPHTEIGHLKLPAPEAWWRAEGEAAWEAARSREVYHEARLQESYTRLFSPGEDASGIAPSSFGNYVLIHCLIQQVFFSGQLAAGLPFTDSKSISSNMRSRIDMALKRWQRNWEATKDSSLDPSPPSGPLSFNSTALFRLAHIRLNADFGACRQLETGDPGNIARGFRDVPLLKRSPYVGRAVLQSAHSLSIPVRIGIEFVARTQALTWSIVHSLCNLECGMFLAKWLETMAFVLEIGEVLRDDEKRLLGIVASIIGETDLGPELHQEHDNVRRAKVMATAVLRLWGYTFKGVHVYDIMGIIGTGLDLCADALQQEIDGN